MPVSFSADLLLEILQHRAKSIDILKHSAPSSLDHVQPQDIPVPNVGVS